MNRTLSTTPGITKPHTAATTVYDRSAPAARVPSAPEGKVTLEVAPLVLGAAGLVISSFALGFAAQKLIRKAKLQMVRGKRAAVVLCGAGYLDGSEITEAVAVLTALSKCQAQVQVFAPDSTQADVVDHASSSAKGFAPRNMLQEAARISRGGIRALDQLNPDEFDVLIIPGGFGVAKSLSKWATEGPSSDFVEPALKSILLAFRAKRKVIALCCISPVLALKTLTPCTLTLGKPGPEKDWPYGGTVGAARAMKNVTVVECEATEICVDKEARLVTAPAYMSAAPRHEIVEGVYKMVYAALALVE